MEINKLDCAVNHQAALEQFTHRCGAQVKRFLIVALISLNLVACVQNQTKSSNQVDDASTDKLSLPVSRGSNNSSIIGEAKEGEDSETEGNNITQKGGKIIIAAPAKVCRSKGGQFANSFSVPNVGEPFLYVIQSIKLDTKFVKTGDELEVRVIKNRKTLKANALRQRTSEFVVTSKQGFGHIPLFSEESIEVKVFAGEKLSIMDPFMRNFGKRACVKLRPKRLPE